MIVRADMAVAMVARVISGEAHMKPFRVREELKEATQRPVSATNHSKLLEKKLVDRTIGNPKSDRSLAHVALVLRGTNVGERVVRVDVGGCKNARGRKGK